MAGFTPTKENKAELDKLISGDLLKGGPVLWITNFNDAVLASRVLDGAMTERPYKVRPFGVLKNVVLDGAPFVVANGNGLKPSQDLVRRFPMFVQLDAQMENPALRKFPLPDQAFLADIERRRYELLAAALTIWRFGRQNAERLTVGRPLGSYSDWERWCRDPLLTLDCRDPVDRVEVLAAADPRRQDIAGIFIAWHEKHGQAPMLAAPSARGGGEAPRSEARARRGRSAAADQAAACQARGRPARRVRVPDRQGPQAPERTCNLHTKRRRSGARLKRFRVFSISPPRPRKPLQPLHRRLTDFLDSNAVVAVVFRVQGQKK